MNTDETIEALVIATDQTNRVLRQVIQHLYWATKNVDNRQQLDGLRDELTESTRSLYTIRYGQPAPSGYEDEA